MTSIELSVTSDVTRQLYHTICRLSSEITIRDHYGDAKKYIYRKNTFLIFCILLKNDPKMFLSK